MTVYIDHVDAIGPAGISLFRSVIESIDHGRKFNSQLAHAGSGDRSPLRVVLRTTENNFILNVAGHLPHIAGMSFENVDSHEGCPTAVLIVKRVERGNLPPKRRSSVTAKNQDNRLLVAKSGQLDVGGLVEGSQGKVWGG